MLYEAVKIGVPGDLLARETFNHEAGALTGKEAPLGGTWTVVSGSDSSDFTVESLFKIGGRAATSDASLDAGRMVTAGTTTHAAIAAQIGLAYEGIGSGDQDAIAGVLVRCVDKDNWLAGVMRNDGEGNLSLQVRQRLEGNTVVLMEEPFEKLIYKGAFLRLGAFGSGIWALEAARRVQGNLGHVGEVVPIQTGYSAALAKGGALEDGKVGLIHANVAAGGKALLVDDYFAWDPGDVGAVAYAGRSVELASDGAHRQAKDADVWGQVVPDGFHPEDVPGRPSRGILIATQSDLGALPDVGTNPLSADVKTRAGHLYARGGEG